MNLLIKKLNNMQYSINDDIVDHDTLVDFLYDEMRNIDEDLSKNPIIIKHIKDKFSYSKIKKIAKKNNLTSILLYRRSYKKHGLPRWEILKIMDGFISANKFFDRKIITR